VAIDLDWDTVMRDIYPAVARTIQHRMSKCLRPRYDAEDFVSEAILIVLADPAAFVAAANPTAFLVCLATRRLLNALKSPRGRETNPDHPLDLELPTSGQADERAGVELREWILTRLVDAEMNELLSLKLDGVSARAIGVAAGRSKDSVEKKMKAFRERYFHVG